MYHIKYMNIPHVKRDEFIKNTKALIKVAEKSEYAEGAWLFHPRGSSYLFAIVTKCKDYASWEKFWYSPETMEVRRSFAPINMGEKDRFFDEVKIE
jgi:hypothetical protein